MPNLVDVPRSHAWGYHLSFGTWGGGRYYTGAVPALPSCMTERFVAADAVTGCALTLELIADWLEDRANFLVGYDDFGAAELTVCAAAVRYRMMGTGGMIQLEGAQ